MSKYKIAFAILLTAIIAGIASWEAAHRLRVATKNNRVSPEPKIHVMQCGVNILKLMLLDDEESCRLHLLTPLPITGESGKIIDITKIQKKIRR